MRELLRSPFYLVTVDDERRIVRRLRTERPFDSLEQIEEAYEAVNRALARLDRSRYGLLIDVRLAPARNDTAYEQVVKRHQLGLHGGFRRLAFLVRTEAGRLQVSRMARVKGIPHRAFVDDEPAALAYLLEPDP